jgi:nucleoid-associated protein YgaU
MGILDNLKSVLGGRKSGRDKTGSGKDSSTYTVKSGDTLWRIAEACYGDGSKYLQIFEANKDLLQSPEAVVPGQVLQIPAADSH